MKRVMGGTYSMQGEMRNVTKFWSESRSKRDHKEEIETISFDSSFLLIPFHDKRL
jgi:hypothetical protein